eukprot:352199-Chlamydomonas_euryale.AAC.17
MGASAFASVLKKTAARASVLHRVFKLLRRRTSEFPADAPPPSSPLLREETCNLWVCACVGFALLAVSHVAWVEATAQPVPPSRATVHVRAGPPTWSLPS